MPAASPEALAAFVQSAAARPDGVFDDYLRALGDKFAPRQAHAAGAIPLKLFGDSPYARLPTYFSPRLFDRLERVNGIQRDPAFPDADPGDFRARRSRMVKRKTIPLMAPPAVVGDKPRLFMVRLRQEWVFLGYTLGPLTSLESLDPGRMIDESLKEDSLVRTEIEEQSAASIRDSLTNAKRVLQEASSLELVEKVSESTTNTVETSTGASVGLDVSVGGVVSLVGSALGIGGSGGVGVGGEVGTSTTTSATLNSSLLSTQDATRNASESLQQATRTVNEAVNRAAKKLHEVHMEVTRTVSQVSPLLSRVTNMMRWSVYENYAVLTFIEEVHVLERRPLCSLLPRPADVPVVKDQPWVLTVALKDTTWRPKIKALATKKNVRSKAGRRKLRETLQAYMQEHGKDLKDDAWQAVLAWIHNPQKVTFVRAPDPPCPKPCFTAEHIVEYEPYFTKGLLRPELKGMFRSLATEIGKSSRGTPAMIPKKKPSSGGWANAFQEATAKANEVVARAAREAAARQGGG